MSALELATKIGYEEIRSALGRLSSPLKDLISGEIGGKLICEIAERYGVDPYYFPDLMTLVSLYLTRLITPQEFVDELAELVPERYFARFMEELENKVWSSYDVFLIQAGIAYKHLTKLTPQPKPAPATPTETESAKPAQPEEITPSPVVKETTESAMSVVPPRETRPQETSITSPESTPSLKETVITSPSTENSPSPTAPLETPKPKTLPETEARISFEALRNFVSRSTPPLSTEAETESVSKTEPEIKAVKFEMPKPVEDLSPEIRTQTEEKQVKIPQPPTVPKTEVKGREVIDLSNFGLSKPDEE